jgi:hypothetical protein
MGFALTVRLKKPADSCDTDPSSSCQVRINFHYHASCRGTHLSRGMSPSSFGPSFLQRQVYSAWEKSLVALKLSRSRYIHLIAALAHL